MLVPESGDSIQTLKAGLMEIADMFVVNKADRPGADRLRNELELMLGLRSGRDDAQRAGAPRRRPRRSNESGATGARSAREATTPSRGRRRCCAPLASKGEGIAELVDALDRHFGYLETSGDAARSAAARGCASASSTSWKTRRGAGCGPTPRRTQWLEDRLPELEAGRDEAVRDRRRAARAERGPSDGDGRR